jgi:hypothetical protein
MPRIQVQTKVPGCTPEVILSERVQSEMLANGHYPDQLVARMSWALAHAEQHEQSPQQLHTRDEPSISGVAELTRMGNEKQ